MTSLFSFIKEHSRKSLVVVSIEGREQVGVPTDSIVDIVKFRNYHQSSDLIGAYRAMENYGVSRTYLDVIREYLFLWGPSWPLIDFVRKEGWGRNRLRQSKYRGVKRILGAYKKFDNIDNSDAKRLGQDLYGLAGALEFDIQIMDTFLLSIEDERVLLAFKECMTSDLDFTFQSPYENYQEKIYPQDFGSIKELCGLLKSHMKYVYEIQVEEKGNVFKSKERPHKDPRLHDVIVTFNSENGHGFFFPRPFLPASFINGIIRNPALDASSVVPGLFRALRGSWSAVSAFVEKPDNFDLAMGLINTSFKSRMTMNHLRRGPELSFRNLFIDSLKMKDFLDWKDLEDDAHTLLFNTDGDSLFKSAVVFKILKEKYDVNGESLVRFVTCEHATNASREMVALVLRRQKDEDTLRKWVEALVSHKHARVVVPDSLLPEAMDYLKSWIESVEGNPFYGRNRELRSTDNATALYNHLRERAIRSPNRSLKLKGVFGRKKKKRSTDA